VTAPPSVAGGKLAEAVMHSRIRTGLAQLGGYVEQGSYLWVVALLGGCLYGLGYALASPRDLLAITAVVLVGMAVALLVSFASATPTASPLRGLAVALREKAWSAAFQRLLDPSAAGRPRPRAPSRAPAAA
jgi:hypothetical protein